MKKISMCHGCNTFLVDNMSCPVCHYYSVIKSAGPAMAAPVD